MKTLSALLVVLCSLFSLSAASAGDRDWAFLNCIPACETRDCTPGSNNPDSFFLRATGWTCLDDCKYSCMHSITNQRAQSRQEIYQYYGKWPFYRLWGMQEPASVAFSLWNLYFHIQGAKRIWTEVPAGHPLKVYYLAQSLINLNTWTWSAVFHTRGE